MVSHTQTASDGHFGSRLSSHDTDTDNYVTLCIISSTKLGQHCKYTMLSAFIVKKIYIYRGKKWTLLSQNSRERTRHIKVRNIKARFCIYRQWFFCPYTDSNLSIYRFWYFEIKSCGIPNIAQNKGKKYDMLEMIRIRRCAMNQTLKWLLEVCNANIM